MRCKDCGSTNIGWAVKDSPPIYTCDHLASGNASCPCGYYLNEDVKAVCSYGDNGEQIWYKPYGQKGLSLEEAEKELEFIKESLVLDVDSMDETDRLKVMWDRQMITGEVYITRLREIGDKNKKDMRG